MAQRPGEARAVAVAAMAAHARSLQAPQRARARAPARGRSSRAHIIGVVVSETTSEIRIAADSVTANSRNSRPTMPPISRIGMNTAISDRLIDSTVKPTSRAPRSAASNGVMPCSMWRDMFSSTTIASSTTKPVAMVSAISERLLSEKPARYMTPKVPISDTGTATLGISVARPLRRNRNTTRITSADRDHQRALDVAQRRADRRACAPSRR